MGPLNVQSSRIALRNLKAYGNGKSLFRLSIGQCKGKTDPRRRHKKKSSPAYGENKKKKAKSRLKSMFGHSSGRDQRRTGCSFLVLWVQSQSLGISSICLWWYVHLQKYWLWPGRNRFLHYYFSNWREDAWLSISGIFKPVEIQKKKTMKPVHKLIIMQISNRYPFSHYLRCFLPSVGNKPASGRLPEEP